MRRPWIPALLAALLALAFAAPASAQATPRSAVFGDSGWPARLWTLKQAPTSVNRIEVSVGSWGVRDWGTSPR